MLLKIVVIKWRFIIVDLQKMKFTPDSKQNTSCYSRNSVIFIICWFYSFKDESLQTAFVFGEWYHNYDTFMTYKFLALGRKIVYFDEALPLSLMKCVESCKVSNSHKRWYSLNSSNSFLWADIDGTEVIPYLWKIKKEISCVFIKIWERKYLFYMVSIKINNEAN